MSAYWIGFLVLAGLFIVVLLVVSKESAGTRQYPYVKAGPLLSPAEAKFFTAVLVILQPGQLLLTKIRVADLIKVKPGTARDDNSSGFWKAFSQISQKHADFVVVDRASFEALVVIELDDASHNSRRSADKDSVKDKAFAAAGIPLLRVKAAGHYEARELALRLNAAIDKGD